jgi:tyrosinase
MRTATRRDLFRLTTGGAVLAAAGSVMFLERVDAQTPTYRVRRDVGAMAANDPVLEALRQAVAAMKALPASDKRSWNNQAIIHYNYCPHGNWYFLPWHRAYLLEFEDICRSLLPSSSPLKTTFAVPFWNWTQNRTLASLGGGAFTTTATWNGQPNPLRNTTRTLSPTTRLPDEIVGQSVIDNALAQTQFEVFASSRPSGQSSTSTSWQRVQGTSGPLEGTPHNSVHNWIGGEMSDMYSPRDCLFWLHHANCDRLWAEWNVRGNVNTSNSLWRDFVFRQNFVRGTLSGNKKNVLYDVTVRNLTDILAQGYYYQYGGPRPATTAAAVSSQLATAVAAAAAELKPIATATATEALSSQTAAAELKPIATFSAPNAQSARPLQPLAVNVAIGGGAPFGKAVEVILRLHDVALVAPNAADALVRVFIDSPSVAPQAPAAGPFYVGTFSFFGSHALHEPGSFALSLTRTVKALLAAGHVFGGALAVQIVPVARAGGAQQIEVKPAEVEVTFYE